MRLYTMMGVTVVSLVAASAVAQEASMRYDRDRDRTMVAERHDDDDNGDWCAYKNNELNFSFFGTGTVGDDTLRHATGRRVIRDGRLGAGVGIQYFPHRNIGIEGAGYTENTAHHFVDNAEVNLILRFPLWNTGVAPYAIGGAGRQFDPLYQWTFNVGAGIEWRFSPHVGLFVDGRYVIADETDEYGLGRAGLRVGF